MTTEVHIEMLFKNRMFSKASHEMSESELRPYKSRLSLYISVLIYIPSTMFTDIHNLQTSTGIPNAHHIICGCSLFYRFATLSTQEPLQRKSSTSSHDPLKSR